MSLYLQLIAKLKPSQRLIYNYIKLNPNVTQRQIIGFLQHDERTVRRNINIMVEVGLLNRKKYKGDRNNHYTINARK